VYRESPPCILTVKNLDGRVMFDTVVDAANSHGDLGHMPQPKTLKNRVIRVDHDMRKMAAQTVVTSQIVAGHFELHTTDLRVLDIIYMRGEATAGDLAKATGLTSGSVTALVDRLSHAGYVERQADHTDRRKVWVRSRNDAIEPIKQLFLPSQIRMFELWSTFKAAELDVIADFLERTTLLAAECAEDIQRHTKPTAPRRRNLKPKEKTR
jgi:DNA-binding MarR family transcriptional regulator